MGPEPVGRMVRRLRLDADLTLERLSEASGISDRALSDIERGAVRGPQHRTVLAIGGAFDLPDVARAAMVRAARDGRRRAKPPAPRRLPLPRDVSDFTGREVELLRITAALTGVRNHRSPLVVITGPPGHGKTSLAVRAAALVRDAFPDQLFVDLRGLTREPPTPGVVLARVLRALTGQESSASGDPELLRQLLADRPVLLVLDDAAVESQVRAVLPAAAPAAVLVTSRRSLAGLDGAQRVPLDRLRSEEAQQLLAAIIPPEQAAGADLAGLARLCDDVPLALRIAGNRLASRPGWTVEGLAARLAVADRRLDTLMAGDLRIRASIGLSFARLGPAAQRLFRRLALVEGPTFSAGLAGVLIGEQPWYAEDLLNELADLSLVQPAAGDRYALHDLLRLYARAELAAHELPAARAAIRAAADEWLLSTAARAAGCLRPGIQAARPADPDVIATPGYREAARVWLTEEAENWSAALERAMRRGDRPAVADLAEVAPWLYRSRRTSSFSPGKPATGGLRNGGNVPSRRPAIHLGVLGEAQQMVARR